MKDKTQADIERGQKAAQIMNDPLMIEAREHIESELWRLFKAAVPTDFEALSQIKSMQYMHGKYEAFLRACIQDGKLATLDIEREKKSLRQKVFG